MRKSSLFFLVRFLRATLHDNTHIVHIKWRKLIYSKGTFAVATLLTPVVHRQPHGLHPSKLARRNLKKIDLYLAKKIEAESEPSQPTAAIKREREIIKRNFFIFPDNCSFVSVFEVMRNCGCRVHGSISNATEKFAPAKLATAAASMYALAARVVNCFSTSLSEFSHMNT